jgi:hypothetical protein
MSFAGTWIELESILSEIVRLRKTNMTCFLSHIKNLDFFKRHESRGEVLGKNKGMAMVGQERAIEEVAYEQNTLYRYFKVSSSSHYCVQLIYANNF